MSAVLNHIGQPIGNVWIDRTAAEIAASVTPTNYQYPPGDVRRYGAVGDGTTDDTAAIQRAIDVGLDVHFYGATYRAANLTQSADFQRFYAHGDVRITKNANGPILACSGDNVEINGIGFRGDASSPTFTGDGVTSSGDNFRLINCGSRWCSGAAVLATGNHTQILGTCDIYQTTDATGSGYDIELGVTGTATLYHEIQNIYTSQSTGGIKLVDTGGARLIGGQFGKLYINAATGVLVGTNGGETLGCRITGAVSVERSTAVFAGNHFSAVAITFGASTSGCRMDASNAFDNGHTITNSGNANNLIIRQVSSGSTINLQFGDDSSAAVLEIVPTATGSFEFSKDIRIKNTQAVILESSSGSSSASLSISSGDNVGFTNSVSAKGFIFTQAGAGTINFDINSARSMQIDANNTAGNTRFLIYDVDNATLERVTVGVADSGGVGFKVLRIPN